MMKGKGGMSERPWAVEVSNRLGGDDSLYFLPHFPSPDTEGFISELY